MFPIIGFGQSLNFTTWEVTINGNVINFHFLNDTIKVSGGGLFIDRATYQDSSNHFLVKDYLDTSECGSYIGLYSYQILNDSLYFNLISDTCSGRAYFFTNSIWESTNTAIETEGEIYNLKTYPNPTNQNITISINNFSGNIQTEVYDLIGNRLQISNETTISLRDYARGIYLLKVAYGDRVEEVKVIKE